MTAATRTHLARAPIHPALIRPVAVARPARELWGPLLGPDPAAGTVLETTAGEP